MKLIFWDRTEATYHSEKDVRQCVVSQTVAREKNRNCYVLFYSDTPASKCLMRSRYELERIEE